MKNVDIRVGDVYRSNGFSRRIASIDSVHGNIPQHPLFYSRHGGFTMCTEHFLSDVDRYGWWLDKSSVVLKLLKELE